jgi:hypothetical protein
MKIFQYSLLVNRNGVFVLTAKGILKFVMKNFTTAFVRELYVKCTSKHPKGLKTDATTFVYNIASDPICKIVVPLLYQRGLNKKSTAIAKVIWLKWGAFELNAGPRRLLRNVGSRGSSNRI